MICVNDNCPVREVRAELSPEAAEVAGAIDILSFEQQVDPFHQLYYVRCTLCKREFAVKQELLYNIPTYEWPEFQWTDEGQKGSRRQGGTA